MLLHRYFGSHAFETLSDLKLKTSRISGFNDPFEFLFRTTGNMTAKKARDYFLARRNNPDFLQTASQFIPNLSTSKRAIKALDKKLPQLAAIMVANFEKYKSMSLDNRVITTDQFLRVVCFSDAKVEPLDEILIWSHYAKKHEGVRIGFEIPDGINPFKIFKIKYQKERHEVDFSNGFLDEAVGQAYFDSAKVKSLAWQYENEYRLLTLPRFCMEKAMPDSTTEHFLDFNRAWVKSIDFGVRCPETEIQQVLNLIKTNYPKSVICRKAAFHKSEFALEYNEI